MPLPPLQPATRKALAVIRSSGNVVVDADLPTSDLMLLAGAAAQWRGVDRA